MIHRREQLFLEVAAEVFLITHGLFTEIVQCYVYSDRRPNTKRPNTKETKESMDYINFLDCVRLPLVFHGQRIRPDSNYSNYASFPSSYFFPVQATPLGEMAFLNVRPREASSC